MERLVRSPAPHQGLQHAEHNLRIECPHARSSGAQAVIPVHMKQPLTTSGIERCSRAPGSSPRTPCISLAPASMRTDGALPQSFSCRRVPKRCGRALPPSHIRSTPPHTSPLSFLRCTMKPPSAIHCQPKAVLVDSLHDGQIVLEVATRRTHVAQVVFAL